MNRTRRRAQPLSRDQILRAALHVVDAEGLDALTMRRVGAELGVEAMSLYRHVRDKQALLDGIHEAVMASVEVPASRGSWRRQLDEHARAFRRALGAHPQALPLMATRPAVTPGSLRLVEAALGALRSAGFDRRDCLFAMQILATFVLGHALAQWGSPAGSSPNSPSFDPLGRMASLPESEFPNLIALGIALRGYDFDAEFDLGLELILDGLEQRLRRQRAPAGRPRRSR